MRHGMDIMTHPSMSSILMMALFGFMSSRLYATGSSLLDTVNRYTFPVISTFRSIYSFDNDN